MHLFRNYRRFFSSIALFAVLLNALAPTVTFAKAAAEGRTLSFAEICTAAGMKRVALDGSGAQSPADRPQQMTSAHDCPFCTPHAGSVGVLNTHVFSLALPLAGNDVPRLFLRAPNTQFVWSTQQARAPPAFS